eukprot:585127-Lingulodinium_polyedra.AAC.1
MFPPPGPPAPKNCSAKPRHYDHHGMPHATYCAHELDALHQHLLTATALKDMATAVANAMGAAWDADRRLYKLGSNGPGVA